jgi:hypothetical protein
MDEHGRLHDTAERLISDVSSGDDEDFRTIWNHLTVADQRAIAASLMSEVAELRRRDDQHGRLSTPAETPSRARVALRVLKGAHRS